MWRREKEGGQVVLSEGKTFTDTQKTEVNAKLFEEFDELWKLRRS